MRLDDSLAGEGVVTLNGTKTTSPEAFGDDLTTERETGGAGRVACVFAKGIRAQVSGEQRGGELMPQVGIRRHLFAGCLRLELRGSYRVVSQAR